MQELENAYRMLDLEPGASMEEVNQAYKDLVFIWHPDRLPKDNTRLIEKAQEKLKQLNQAREYLRTHARVASSSRTNSSRSTETRSRSYARTRSYGSTRPRSSYSARSEYRSTSSAYGQRSQPSSGNGHAQSAESTYYRTPYGSYYGRATSSRYNGSDGNGSASSNSSNSSRTTYTERDRATADTHNKPHRGRQDPDLSGSNFRGANLREKDFSGRNLSSADLSGADLQDAFLHRVNLNRANLSKANLFRANLLQADLSHANLREANLMGADLSGADLSGADLSGAQVGVGNKIMVKLTGTILRGTIMPDGTIHA